MEKKNFDLKLLKGKNLSRDEMKNIVGGDGIACYDCGGADSGTCWAKFCGGHDCFFYQENDRTYLCYCIGNCM